MPLGKTIFDQGCQHKIQSPKSGLLATASAHGPTILMRCIASVSLAAEPLRRIASSTFFERFRGGGGGGLYGRQTG